MSDELARARTLVLWATLVAGVALFVLVVDLRTKQDLLEVYRREQATRGTRVHRDPGQRDMVDDPARTPPAPAPDDDLPHPGAID